LRRRGEEQRRDGGEEARSRREEKRRGEESSPVNVTNSCSWRLNLSKLSKVAEREEARSSPGRREEKKRRVSSRHIGWVPKLLEA